MRAFRIPGKLSKLDYSTNYISNIIQLQRTVIAPCSKQKVLPQFFDVYGIRMMSYSNKYKFPWKDTDQKKKRKGLSLSQFLGGTLGGKVASSTSPHTTPPETFKQPQQEIPTKPKTEPHTPKIEQIPKVVQPENPLSLYVALVGPANVGKSTLVNRLVGMKISPVSPKAQTTREQVIGVYSKGNVQLVFLDTPGIIPTEEAKQRQRELVVSAWNTIEEADMVLLLVDSTNPSNDNNMESIMTRLFEEAKKKEKSVVLVLNKMDLSTKDRMQYLKSHFFGKSSFSEYFFTSALRYKGVDDLRDFLMFKAVPRPWRFNAEMKTDQTAITQVDELIREKLFKYLNQELPYVIKIENVSWNELPNGELVVEEAIIVPKESQKAIVIGANGSKLNLIKKEAQENLVKLFNRNVTLKVHVKFRKPQE